MLNALYLPSGKKQSKGQGWWTVLIKLTWWWWECCWQKGCGRLQMHVLLSWSGSCSGKELELLNHWCKVPRDSLFIWRWTQSRSWKQSGETHPLPPSVGSGAHQTIAARDLLNEGMKGTCWSSRSICSLTGSIHSSLEPWGNRPLLHYAPRWFILPWTFEWAACCSVQPTLE